MSPAVTDRGRVAEAGRPRPTETDQRMTTNDTTDDSTDTDTRRGEDVDESDGSAPELTDGIPDPETAKEHGVVIDVGEGAPETVREAFNGFPGHGRGTWAHVDVVLTTADLERILLEVEEHGFDSIAGWIRMAIWGMLVRRDRQKEQTVQVDVPVPEPAWERAKLIAAGRYQTGSDPETAFHETMVEAVPTAYNYVRKGSPPSEEPLTHRDLPVREGQVDAEERGGTEE